MKIPHVVVVLEGSEDPIFSINSFDHKFVKDDFFTHTVGGVTNTYKVKEVILEVESRTGDPEITSNWTTFVLRVTASLES